MRFRVTMQASDGEVFTPSAFDDLLATEIPVTVADGAVSPGLLVSAQVAEDGLSAELEFDVPEGTAASAAVGRAHLRGLTVADEG